MYKPKFRIKKILFSSKDETCLGSQLITIINFLQEILEPHVWYLADINPTHNVPFENNFDSLFLKKIGNDACIK